MDIIVNNLTTNLGDTLGATCLFKKQKGKIVFKDTPKGKNIASLFNDLAEVEFTKLQIEDYPDVNTLEPLPRSQKLLNYFGISDVTCIPKIKISKNEQEWAREFLKDYKNPVAIVATTGDKNNYRKIRPEAFEELISGNPQFTFLNFGITKKEFLQDKPNFQPIKHTIEILDLDIRKLAACYSVIKKYIGCDTGDYHLMLAVGGEANVLVPKSNFPIYHYPLHHYTVDLWKNEPIRVNYMTVTKK